MLRLGKSPKVRWGWGPALVPCLCGLCWVSVARADFVGFTYGPIDEPILSASFSGDFAALTAHRWVVGYEVNFARLVDQTMGLPPLDLSDELFGTAAWPDPPQLDMGDVETGWISAEIDPSFYPALVGGRVGLQFCFTDTDDAMFAIDTLILTIETGRTTIESFYGWPIDNENNGFGIGIPDGGDLPEPAPGSLEETGTGWDEWVNCKTPEPTALLLMAAGTLALLRCRGAPGREGRREDERKSFKSFGRQS